MSDDKNPTKELLSNFVKVAAGAAVVGAGAVVASEVLKEDNRKKLEAAAKDVGEKASQVFNDIKEKGSDAAAKLKSAAEDGLTMLTNEFETFKGEMDKNEMLDKDSKVYKQFQTKMHELKSKIEASKDLGEDKAKDAIEKLKHQFDDAKQEYSKM